MPDFPSFGPAPDPLITAEIARLDELGFPPSIAGVLAERAFRNHYLPVADPSLPAGPSNKALKDTCDYGYCDNEPTHAVTYTSKIGADSTAADVVETRGMCTPHAQKSITNYGAAYMTAVSPWQR